VAFAHVVASLDLATTVFLCQQLILNIAIAPIAAEAQDSIQAGQKSSQLHLLVWQEPSSMAKGETFEINLKSLL
jgi:hypothetical protein